MRCYVCDVCGKMVNYVISVMTETEYVGKYPEHDGLVIEHDYCQECFDKVENCVKQLISRKGMDDEH